MPSKLRSKKNPMIYSKYRLCKEKKGTIDHPVSACSKIALTGYKEYITRTLKSLHWLPIFFHINFKIYCITHCALSLGEPFYLSTLLTHRSNTHSLRTTSFSLLLLSYFNKKSNDFRIFSYAAPFLLNHLPDTVRSAITYMSFRRNLKTYLFNQAFPT